MIKLSTLINILLIIQLLSSPFIVKGESSDLKLNLSFTNLADPGMGHYEGWLIVDGSAISTGSFSIDSNKKLIDLDGNEISAFSVKSIDLEKTTKFVLTLEPKDDTDKSPSNIKLLAGDLNSDRSSASISNNIGVDFSSISGKYILATPTNGADTNENSGIWFLDLSSGSPAMGLSLPDLSNTDWIYEGWVVINGVPVTTGTFDNTTDFDKFDGYSSTQGGPPFPGEDFLVNAPTGLTFPTDISGMTAVISIEPRVDNDAAPFQFKPLVGSIPTGASDHVTYTMSDMTSSFATGSLTIEKVSNESSTPGFSAYIAILGISALLITHFIRKRKQ